MADARTLYDATLAERRYQEIDSILRMAAAALGQRWNATLVDPTLICCKTAIGQGAPTKAGGHDVHGAPLGAQEIAAMRAQKG